MILGTIASIFLLQFSLANNSFHYVSNSIHQSSLVIDEDIDSMDIVKFDINQLQVIDSHTVEIPIYIFSDDVINAMDFSMVIDTGNLEFISIVDHTGDLQYAAFLNPNDLKLRFTSNSFTPYPMFPQKVISIRFRVLSPVLYSSDFNNALAYLNGEPCAIEVPVKDFPLSATEIITDEIFINPNPATDGLYIFSEGPGLVTMIDQLGRIFIREKRIQAGETMRLDVAHLPRGTYLVFLKEQDHTMKTQKIVLQ